MDFWFAVGDIASIITITLFVLGVIRWVSRRKNQGSASGSTYTPSTWAGTPVIATPKVKPPRVKYQPNLAFREAAWTGAGVGALVGGLLVCISIAIWQISHNRVYDDILGAYLLFATFAAVPASLLGCAIGLKRDDWIGFWKAVGLVLLGIVFYIIGMIAVGFASAWVVSTLFNANASFGSALVIVVVTTLAGGGALGLWVLIALYDRIS